jgi:hypothetical protein
MGRLILITVIIGILASGAAWIVNASSENTRLSLELSESVSSNETLISEKEQLKKFQTELEKSIMEWGTRNKTIRKELNVTKRRLIDAARNPKITVVQKECMDSVIPSSVLDELRKPPNSLSYNSAPEDLPSSSLLPTSAFSRIPRFDVVRACRSCSGTKLLYYRIEFRPKIDRGVL